MTSKLKFIVVPSLLLMCSINAHAGIITFNTSHHNQISFSESIVGTGPGVGATALFNNPFTEQGTDNFYFEGSNFLIIGSGGLTLSWDVTFDQTVSLTEIELGNPVSANLGFNVVGAGVNESGLLAGALAGNHVLPSPLQFLANQTYTFSAVNRNVTPPVTQSGGLRFAQWTFGENAVPEPTSLAIFGIGALGLVVRHRRKRKQTT